MIFFLSYIRSICCKKQKIPLSDRSICKGRKLFRGTTFFHFFPYGKKSHRTRSYPLRCNGRSRRPYSACGRCSRRGSRKEFTRGSWLSSHRRQLSWHERSDLLVSGHRQFSPIIIDCQRFVKGFCEFFGEFAEKFVVLPGKSGTGHIKKHLKAVLGRGFCRTAQKNIAKSRKIPQNIVKKHLHFKEKCVILLSYNSRVR